MSQVTFSYLHHPHVGASIKMASSKIVVQCTQVPRFTIQRGLNAFYIDVPKDGDRLAISGHKEDTKSTFIDLFALNKYPVSHDLSLLMKSQPYFSKEFTKIEDSPWRCVCLLDDSVFVTCCFDTIESYDTKHGRLVNRSRLSGEARCMTTTRDGRVYVGFNSRNGVSEFDGMLNQVNEITLKGLNDFPTDITVSNNKLLICTFRWRALMYNMEGDEEYEFKKPNHQYIVALSITVSEENGLICISWGDGVCKCVIVVYSLDGGHSSLPGGHASPPNGNSSLPGGHSSISCCHLASLIASDHSYRVRINNNVNKLFVVTRTTGEIYEYNTNDIINLENLLTLIELLITKDDCQKLLNYFEVPHDTAQLIQESDEPSKSLLQHLRETGTISAKHINLLLTACNDQGINQVEEARINYEQFLSYQKVSLLQLKQSENQRKELSEKLIKTENYRQELTERLKETQLRKEELADRLVTEEKERQQVTDKLRESEDEREQLTKRLDEEEKERAELTNRLKAFNLEHQQLVSRLHAAEKEKKELTHRITETDYEKQQLRGRLDVSIEEQQRLRERLEATEIERQQIRMPITEKELQDLYDEEKRLKKQLDVNHQTLEETKSSLRAAKDDLVQAQVKYAKESIVLQEVLQQTREALNTQLNSKDSMKEDDTLRTEVNDASEMSQALTTLAADYGKLMIDVADDLTLDNSLRLATLFQLPNSETDMIRRISLLETPGISLINFLKARNVINMYDVTNLEKGLLRLHLNNTNTKYVVPYQQRVDPFQFEENRSPHLIDWPDEEIELPNKYETFPPLQSGGQEKSEGNTNDQNEGRLEEKIKKGEEPRPRPHFQSSNMAQPYIEHKINYEGGTVTLMGVCLSISDGALSCDHIIAVTVIHDSDVLLPGSAQRGRMTPLIKLEPEGLKLNKPARLTIPHSAIIPEPDRHSVIIFTGQPTQGESHKGHLTWTEENFLQWRLEKEQIIVDVNTLSYVFVNLVSQQMEQKHMFRIVPFTDGILDVKDDILITVCFCKDNDTDYQFLLDGYKSKLTLGSYITFQVSRTLHEEKDGVSDLALTMSPQRDSYYLAEGEATKLVDVDHLCAASRVSLQFRLHRCKDGMVDVKVAVSQGDKQMDLILQSKINNILLSRESQLLLHHNVPKDLHRYEKLKETVSNLLEKKHCEKLATFFELAPAEMDTVLNNSKPGMELMKILDERELIRPDKVFGLYQGLKASHLDRIGRHVLEYIDESQTQEGNDRESLQQDKNEATKNEPLQEKQLSLPRNVRLLIEEGHQGLDVKRALKLSHGKLDLARRILSLAKCEHERLPLLPGSNIYKEQYIDELGGELVIAGIHLLVPAGALNTGRIVRLSIFKQPGIEGPISNTSLRVTPLVEFGPRNLVLHKPVIMIIPHCAFIVNNQRRLDVYSGTPQKDNTIKWSLERNCFKCSMKESNLQVEIHKPCGLIWPHIPFQQKMKKNICVLPIMKRTSCPEDEFAICLWFYNANSLGHDTLIHEEVYNHKGIVLHDPVSFQIETMGSTLSVSIRTSTSQCTINPNKVEVDVDSLWLLDRHKVIFHFQTKDSNKTAKFEIESTYGVAWKVLFQLNIWFKLGDVHTLDQTTSPFQQVLPKVTTESFKVLLKEISGNLNVEQSIQLANIFKLTEEVISSIEAHRKPGILLMETLTKRYLIAAANISRLEYALTEIGNEQCAKIVREFRRINSLLHATIFPGDDN